MGFASSPRNVDFLCNEINDAIRDAVDESKLNIDPDAYFIWMYSVEPFAEA